MPDRPLSILSVAYPLFPVRSDSAGGAEQILFLLDRTLVDSGHRSIVIAAAGSQVAGRLMPTVASSGEITDRLQSAARLCHAARIQQALEVEDIDLVHFHGLDFPGYLPSTRVPLLASLHLPLAWCPAEVTKAAAHLVCVSRAQAASADALRYRSIIENGIDISQYGPASCRGDYFLWLGRICPEKGTHIALRIARDLDLTLIVAGSLHKFAYHEKYFVEQVEPLLDSKRVYVGPVDLDRKKNLLSEARCLLIPSSAPETSSLVAMEALASGTPVIAFRSGALPEILEDGRTGFIVDSEAAMRAAIDRLPLISSENCLKSARERFDHKRMFAEYLMLYRSLIAGRETMKGAG